MNENILSIIIGVLLATSGILLKKKTGKINYLYLIMGLLICLLGLGIVKL